MSDYKNILITGGAGFVGSNTAISFKRDLENIRVTVLDNLKRRGSELAVTRLADHGVEFFHGDIRNPEDISQAGAFDLLVECSAEPSVHAGYDSSPAYLVNTNLTGTTHCLEMARKNNADIVFLSTSRVYPIQPLRDLPLTEQNGRFEIGQGQSGTGWSSDGISEAFLLNGPRSLYGATKLASELLLTEYTQMYGIRSIINRCGVLTGPWQMGRVDQGFMALWAARHLYGGSLTYMGFGGTGCQVRDILHVADLYRLLKLQLAQISSLSGQVFNVGGGRKISVSLNELTQICEQHSSSHLNIGCKPETRDADIPWYITDTQAVSDATTWQPQHSIEATVEEIFAWLTDHRNQLEPILGS
jgi:CDP-paratose 2-epimerase